MKLNMAERLAKEPIPSFILIFKVDVDLQFSNAYLIHIYDARLAAILKRLRHEHAKCDGKSLNKKVIKFSPLEEETIPISGSGLREAIIRCVGGDIDRYVESKKQQRLSVGYDERPESIKVTFQGLSDAELLDVFLGIRKDVPVLNFESAETRFGIAIKNIPSDSGRITIEPNSLGKCKVLARPPNRMGGMAILFGDFYMTMKVGSCQKAIVRSNIFTIEITDLDASCHVKFEYSTYGKMCDLSEWANFLQLILLLNRDDVMVEIHPPKSKKPLEIKSSYFDLKPSGDKLDAVMHDIFIVRSLESIFSFIGLSSRPLIKLEDIIGSANSIAMVAALMDNVNPNLNLDCDYFGAVKDIDKEIIVASRFYVGEILMAYYAVVLGVSVDSVEGEVGYDVFEFKSVVILDNVEEAFEEFLKSIRCQENIDQVVLI